MSEEVPDRAPLPVREAWQQFQLPVRSWILAPRRQAVNDALYALEDAIANGERPTAEEVRTARTELDLARELVEEHHAALARDVDSWGDGAGMTVSHGVLADQLEAAGYTVLRPGEDIDDRDEEDETAGAPSVDSASGHRTHRGDGGETDD